jgi:hypothetical protein
MMLNHLMNSDPHPSSKCMYDDMIARSFCLKIKYVGDT